LSTLYNGGSAVTEYDVYKTDTNTQHGSPVAAGSPEPDTYSADPLTSVTAGSSYTFYIRARNAYGYGPFSAAFSIKAASAPDALPAAATTTQSGTSVVVTWAAPSGASLNDGGDVTAYIV
jgi:hypothetical protein